ncbi:nucleotidyltransferase family protein [Tabrizicola sp.]|uniref:nucleotidyltransferase family protein n=1 Tax=Tabrizicola sp. TaxID=2005166 RepID=UPI003F384E4A
MDIPILILAAGQSARMRGIDKLAQLVDGEHLLTRVATLARKVSPLVFVALPRVDHPRLRLIADLDVTPLIVKEASEGMSGTLRAGVAALPDCKRFMVLLADLPELTADDLQAVLDAQDAARDVLIWRGATSDGRPGHPILFDASLRPRFADLSGDGGGEGLVNPLRHLTHLVPLPGQRARLDLDTPEDWAAWRASRRE